MSTSSHEHLEFFNVAELTEVPGIPGAVRLSRYPSRLEPHYLNEGGKLVSRFGQGCEVRFRTESERFVVRLSCEEPARVQVHQGDHWLANIELKPGVFSGTLLQKNADVSNLPEMARKDAIYSPELIRVQVQGGLVYFHGVDGFGQKVEKPRPGDVPAKRWLAYGSSITQADTYGYVHAAARLLGIDVLNKGMSGSCALEKETAEFLSQEVEWNFATLELGINIRKNVTPPEFAERVKYLLDQLVPLKKPLFVISIFPNGADFYPEQQDAKATEAAFLNVLQKEVGDRALEYLHFISGREIMARYAWLAADMVHPTHEGHGHMGARLAKILSEKLDLPLLD